METFDIGRLPTPKKDLAEHVLDKRMHMFVDVSFDLDDRVTLYGLQHNMKKQDILLQALQKFMASKSTKSRPEGVKQRKKKGRKAK